MTTPTTLLPRLVRVLLSRDADDVVPPARHALRSRRLRGYPAFLRVQTEYDGAEDPEG